MIIVIFDKANNNPEFAVKVRSNITIYGMWLNETRISFKRTRVTGRFSVLGETLFDDIPILKDKDTYYRHWGSSRSFKRWLRKYKQGNDV